MPGLPSLRRKQGGYRDSSPSFSFSHSLLSLLQLFCLVFALGACLTLPLTNRLPGTTVPWANLYRYNIHTGSTVYTTPVLCSASVSCAQVERQRDKFENTKVRERNERRDKKSVILLAKIQTFCLFCLLLFFFFLYSFGYRTIPCQYAPCVYIALRRLF